MTHSTTNLTALLFLKALVMVAIILFAGIGLSPDEAQYWTWSQKLAAGYYSKPPGIAWQIWLGTEVFGDTELGVRIGSVVLAIVMGLAVYTAARACHLSQKASWLAGIAFALSPIGILSSFFAITDVGLALFWTLATATLAAALNKGETPNYYAVGLWLLCGALFKWPIYLFWIPVFLLMPFIPKLASRHVFGGVLISLLGLLPSLYWNATHEWVTFLHVWTTVSGGHSQEIGTVAPLVKGNTGDFFGAQVLLVSPILFVLAVWGSILVFKQRHKLSSGLLFIVGSTAILFFALLIASFFMKMQGNWGSFIYPVSFAIIAWYATTYDHEKWLWTGVILAVALSALAFLLPSLPIPYKYNPFKHNMGWHQLAPALKEAGYDPSQHFLFSDKYQTTSILSFYGPEQKRAYFLNLQNTRLNQFSFWPDIAEEQAGKSGFFVVVENAPKLSEMNPDTFEEQLQPYFKHAQFIGMYPLYQCGSKTCKAAYIFKADDYSGKLVPQSKKY